MDRKKPAEQPHEWFYIFVIHQNRYRHGNQKNYIDESMLPKWLDLVVWAHEHECIVDPVKANERTDIVQPGSSVVTQLCAGEAKDK